MNDRREDRRGLAPALFIVFWAAQAISLFGDRLNNFSLVALINRFSENPGLTLSSVYLSMYLPIFTLAPLIGVFVDRLNKRWVLVVTDLLRGGLVMLIPFLFTSADNFLPVMAIVFLLTTGNLFFLPAKSSLIPELVRPGRLVRANSILWGAGIAGVIGGFLGGGLIFDYLSWRACFYLDGATYMLSAIMLAVIALRPAGKGRSREVAAHHPPFWSALSEGFRVIRKSRLLGQPLGIQSIIYFGAGGFSVLTMVLIRDASPPGSSMGLSIAGLAMAMGMGAGSVLVNRITLTRKLRLRAETILFALIFPASVLIAAGLGIGVIAAGCFIGGLAASPLVIVSETELQMYADQSVRGRIFSLREILTRSLFLLSAFLMSWLGALAGKDILLAGLGLFLACLGILWIRIMKHGLEARTGE